MFGLNNNKLFTKTEPQLTMVLIARLFVASTILYTAGKLFWQFVKYILFSLPLCCTSQLCTCVWLMLARWLTGMALRKLAHAIYTDFLALKIENFQLKFFDIFEAVLTSTHNLCFGAKIRKLGIPLHTPVLLYKSGV